MKFTSIFFIYKDMNNKKATLTDGFQFFLLKKYRITSLILPKKPF